MRTSFALVALAATVASAKDIVINVGHNTSATNASSVFQPAEVHAQLGDNVVFNFTLGNHTATQSTFASPCIPAHDTNVTINGFDSSFRDAGNASAITILTVPILPENVNTTMWFFDFNTCGEGGVGVINANDSSLETLAGFQRNAVRLNGTGSSTTLSSHSATATSPSGSSSSASASSTQSSSSAERVLAIGGLSVVPFLLGALATL